MAKIILNVELNKGNVNKDLAEIKSQLQDISISKTTVSGVDSLQKSVANLLNTLKSSQRNYAPETFSELEKQLRDCLESVKDLNEEIGDTKPTKEQKAEIARLTKTYQKLSAEFATTRVETEKLNTAQGTSSKAVFNLQKSFANLLKSLTGMKDKYPATTFDQFETQLATCITRVKALTAQIGDSSTINDEQKKELVELSTQYQKLSANIATTAAETKQLDTAVLKSGDGIVAMAKKFVLWQAAATLVMQPLRAITGAFKDWNETLVNTEKRIVEISRVVNENIADDVMANKLYNIAQQYGQTFDNVSEIALNFARAGMSWNDSIKATEAAVLALNVAELDATQASDGMIAIMTQFGIEASQLTDVVDMLNITADNAAVTTEKLLTALQRTGSSAKNARLELDQTVSVITALSEATGRSGENLGTAVNSLIQFSQKSSALDTFAKLSDNMAKIVENYRMGQGNILDIWKGLSEEIKSRQNAESVLGSLLSSDEGKELNEQLKAELGDTFGEITEIYDTASTFRKNYFIALLNNMDKVEEAMDTLQGRADYSAAENEKYLNTYEAKTNALAAKWQQFLNSEQGWLGLKKVFVDIASALLEVWDALGGIWAILPTLFAAIIAFKGQAILTWLVQLGKTLWNFVSGIIPNAIAGWKALAAQQISVNAAIQASIPIFAILAVAISTAISLTNKYKQAQEEARREAIATWKANQENAQKLNEVYDAYQKLTPATEEYYNKEKELIKLLSNDKQNALKGLKQGTDAYAEAVKNLTEAQRKQYEQEYAVAKQAAKEELLSSNIAKNTGYGFGIYNNIGYYGNFKGSQTATAKLYRKYGIDFQSNQLQKATTPEEAVENYEKVKNVADQIYEAYLQALRGGNQEDADKLLKNYAIIHDTVEEYADVVNKYKESKEYWSLFSKSSEETKDNVEYIKKDISEIGDTLRDKVVNALKEARDATQEAYDYEEKKKKVLEAEQALLEAKNQRNVAVFNDATGRFEFVRNEKDVQDAQEKLDEARKDVEDEAYAEISDEIKNGNATNEKILEIIAKWAEAYGSGDFSTIKDDIAAIIKKETGIDINGSAEEEEKTTDDNASSDGTESKGSTLGKLASGIVNGTKGLIEGLLNFAGNQSNSASGLLFGAIKNTASDIIASKNTTNNQTTNNYIANGIQLTRERAENNSFSSVLEAVVMGG
nr:MAG TPA: minor tail protein [Caudoviricetes sp.]